MGKIDRLKYAIFNEWSYNPPGGMATLFFDARGTTYKELMQPISDIYDHLSYAVYDKEEEDLQRTYKAVKGSKKSIEGFSWDNGGSGCDCSFIAEGNDIANKAVNFYWNELADWFGDDEKDIAREKEDIIKNATENPEDYNAVMRLLDMISEAIEYRNDELLSR